MIVLNDVFVPWERVFIYRDITLTRDQWTKTPSHVYGNYQAQVRYATKLRFLLGIMKHHCEIIGVDSLPASQAQLGEMAALASMVELMVEAQETRATVEEGVVWPSDVDGSTAAVADPHGQTSFAIIRNAAWITLYRAVLPFPQVGVFLRCASLAGEAFFTLADRACPEIEPLLRAELGPDLAMEWGACHHPEMTDIAATLPAQPGNDSAAEQPIAWMLRVAAAWWNCFGGPEVNNTSPAKGERHAPAKDRARRAERLSHEADHETQCLG